jgi:hypothetical protein
MKTQIALTALALMTMVTQAHASYGPAATEAAINRSVAKPPCMAQEKDRSILNETSATPLMHPTQVADASTVVTSKTRQGVR